jgi:hypothetical protein
MHELILQFLNVLALTYQYHSATMSILDPIYPTLSK